MKSENDPWFIPYFQHPAAVRLIAVPYAGSGASMYRRWQSQLNGIELYSAQLPGREQRLREPPIGDLQLLIQRMLPSFLALADCPLILFGHSLGALIAYELACQLRQRGITPLHLIVSAFRSPEREPRKQPLHQLPHNELIEALRGYGATSNEVLEHPELLELLLPMIRSDFRLHETYRYPGHPPLHCPITAIIPREDRHIPPEDMADWANKTTANFERVEVDGGHFYLLDQPEAALQVIRRCVSFGRTA